MKKFVYKLSFWLFPVTLTLLTVGILNYYIEKGRAFDKFKNVSKYDNFIFGDSEIGQLNRNNFYNAALGGENYETILRKLKLIRQFKSNKLDTIILGVSPKLFLQKQNIKTVNENSRKSSLMNLYFNNKNSINNNIGILEIHSLIFVKNMRIKGFVFIM
jgi:hypothetical protein